MRHATLIILGGFAGAGKTTVAKALSAEYNLPLVSMDELIAALQKPLERDFHACAPAAYDVGWALVRNHLKNGVTVILDANMCHARTWQNADALRAGIPGMQVVPLILECPIETHKARIEKRGREEPAHVNLGGDAFESILHKYDYITRLRRPDLIRVDADRPFESVYRDVLAHLREALAGVKRPHGTAALAAPAF